MVYNLSTKAKETLWLLSCMRWLALHRKDLTFKQSMLHSKDLLWLYGLLYDPEQAVLSDLVEKNAKEKRNANNAN